MNIRGIKSAIGIYLNRLCFTREVATKIPVAKGNKFPNTNSSLKMDGWQIHNYGTTEELQFATGLRMPIIINSTDCLVRINATTVNPIDVAMLKFPLILGREFCGEVVQCGMGVDNKISVGDRVYGVVPLHVNGSHAQYVVVPEHCLSIAPASLSNEQAASVLYAGLTAWSGLYVTGRLGSICGAVSCSGGGKNRRVLVMGGSGSVGSLAIQLLKSQKVTVYATCSDNAIELVKNLGADYVFDYKNSAEFEALRNYAPFDIVLDCTGQGIELAKNLNFQFGQYITFSSPLLKNVDKFGISFGMLKNITHFIQANMKSLSGKGFFLKYGFFMPAPQGIELLTRLVKKNQLLPIIDSSFTFAELPLAFEKVNRGHLRGKVVITMS
ncbi:reticulon-4-interacting protein 1, mitochondrial isoform X2 [Bactrocera neohumeralis]|uniref:reticulon-4-interacting protein 1, mitochondrial isoform X2 n=1 Tax=Bactrocera tryoni TaxID=59916 RepID=UPI001A97C56D|nr:reticulon-4-interacting protein 1, mitochondrial isoform X2 [Bactrocera tryoni]XP_050338922.1 reticulon-4-interacting protein 1, mitochondrial isoform X2 [Bactrocera neohumeralis]